MARVNWKPRIVNFFEAMPKKVFTRKEIGEILARNSAALGTPKTLSVRRFIETLREIGQLRVVDIESVADETSTERPYHPFVRYTWGAASPYEVALSLRGGSYLSHASAVFLRGLTLQIPRTIYANKEQSEKTASESRLSQQAIDRAFGGKPRTSNYVFDFDGTRIVLLSGKNTGDLEVSDLLGASGEPLRATKIERTLIDIAVRPNYAGGVFDVIQAYRNALSIASAPTIVATLRQLKYVYPYHQAIGFYMQRAGYSESALQRLREMGLQFSFYLTNRIPDPQFDPEWKVFFPRGL